MYITLERLIDGCIHTLREDVMPEVGTRVARGQVWAVIDILQNMRNRIEEKAELCEAESVSSEQALAQLVSALREAGAEDPRGPRFHLGVECQVGELQEI